MSYPPMYPHDLLFQDKDPFFELLYRWFVQNNIADSLAPSMTEDEEQLDALVDDIVQQSQLKSYVNQSIFNNTRP